MAYRIVKSGKIVYGVGGRGMSRGVVARVGQVFEEISNDHDPAYFEEVVRNPRHDADDPASGPEWVPVGSAEASVVEEQEDDEDPSEHGHDANDGHRHRVDYEAVSNEDLELLLADHDVDAKEIEGTGAQGKVLKKDMVDALIAVHEGVGPQAAEDE